MSYENSYASNPISNPTSISRNTGNYFHEFANTPGEVTKSIDQTVNQVCQIKDKDSS